MLIEREGEVEVRAVGGEPDAAVSAVGKREPGKMPEGGSLMRLEEVGEFVVTP